MGFERIGKTDIFGLSLVKKRPPLKEALLAHRRGGSEKKWALSSRVEDWSET